MIRELKIYVNPSEGAITQQEGDGFFYLGDNNRIQVIPEEDVAYVSISGNTPGSGAYIAELVKQEDGSFVLDGEDMNGFLQRVGKVNCNIHIADEEGKRKTTLAFQFESKMGFDRELTTVSPTTALTLEDFYVALEVIKNLNVEEISEAVEIVESLDIEKIEEALEITNTLNTKIEEVDTTLTAAKETDEALKAVLAEINRQLEAGELKGEKGDKGDKGDTGETGPVGPQGPEGPQGPAGADGKDGTMTFEELTEEQKLSLKGDKGDTGEQGPVGPEGPQGPAGNDGKDGENGKDYILTSDDKTEIANEVYSMFTSAEEVSF